MAKGKSVAQLRDEGARVLRERLAESTQGTRDKFWEGFERGRGYESMKVIEVNGQYRQHLPPDMSVTDILELARKSGINPLQLARQELGLTTAQARRLEFMSNQERADKLPAGSLMRKEFEQTHKRTGLTEATAKLLVNFRVALEQKLLKPLVLKPGEKARVFATLDGEKDKESTRRLSGLGTLRDEPGFPAALGGGRHEGPPAGADYDDEYSGEYDDTFVDMIVEVQ